MIFFLFWYYYIRRYNFWKKNEWCIRGKIEVWGRFRQSRKDRTSSRCSHPCVRFHNVEIVTSLLCCRVPIRSTWPGLNCRSNHSNDSINIITIMITILLSNIRIVCNRRMIILTTGLFCWLSTLAICCCRTSPLDSCIRHPHEWSKTPRRRCTHGISVKSVNTRPPPQIESYSTALHRWNHVYLFLPKTMRINTLNKGRQHHELT